MQGLNMNKAFGGLLIGESPSSIAGGQLTYETRKALQGKSHIKPDAHYASNTYAGIIRDQWEDYTKRFAPWEDTLQTLSNGQEDNQLSEQRAANAVDASFKNSQSILSRDRSRMGITMTPEEQADESRIGLGLQSAVKNSEVLKARLHAQDRDNMLLTGGTGLNINSATQKG